MAGHTRTDARGRRLGNVIFEFSAIGNAVKVCAVDPVSGLEVSIVGPASAGEAALRQTAMSKLSYMLDKQRPAPLKRGGLYA